MKWRAYRKDRTRRTFTIRGHDHLGVDRTCPAFERKDLSQELARNVGRLAEHRSTRTPPEAKLREYFDNLPKHIKDRLTTLGLLDRAAWLNSGGKEIGIRKVLGATVSNVIVLFSREFVVLVVWAFIIAAPISFFLMTNWLNEFTYHTNFGVATLLGAGIVSVLIAWLTVSYQSIRAATANPVHSIRSE